jgi:hypothetical protein
LRVLLFALMLPFGISRFQKCYSSFLACQFSSALGGYISTYSLTRNQQLMDWNDSGIIWNGYLVGFSWIRLDTAFLLAVLAGVLYSIYLLMSKSVSDGRTLSWQSASFHQRYFLGVFVPYLSHFSDFQTQVGSFYLFRRSYVNWQLGYQLVTLHNTCEPPGFHWVY